MCLEQSDRAGIEITAVLDRIRTGAQRCIDAIGAVRMHHHLTSQAVGRSHDRDQLVLGELQIDARRFGREDAAGCDDLDEIGAARHLIANHARALVCPGTAMAERRRHGRCGDVVSRSEDTRSLDRASVGCGAQREHDFVFATQIANGRESRHQVLACVGGAEPSARAV